MPGNLPPGATLDSFLTLSEAAEWLGQHPRVLVAKTKGRRPITPAFWENRRVVRFHPRTILAKLASDAGVSLEVVSASLAESLPKGAGPGGAP